VGGAAGNGIAVASNVIAIGAGVSGVDNTFGEVDDACYIGNICGANIPLLEANFVFVDSSGRLGTTLIDARGNKFQIPVQTLQRTTMRGGKVEELQAAITQQQQLIETLTAQLKEQAAQFATQLKEQAAQIQKVSVQLEVSKPAPQVVVNKP